MDNPGKIAVRLKDPVLSRQLAGLLTHSFGSDALADDGAVILSDHAVPADNARQTVLLGGDGLALPVRAGAVLDRVAQARAPGRQPASFSFGPFHVDAAAALLTDSRTGRAARLTEKERDILATLRAHKGALGRPALLDAVWGYAEGIETHTLETHIYRLRRKFEDDPASPRWLLTEEEGYRLAD